MTSAKTTLIENEPIALVTLDTPGSSANVLTTELFEELDQTFKNLAGRTDISGVILYSAKPRIFVAGADLKAINRTLDWPDERIVTFCENGRDIMRHLNTMPHATCAAIHGACVGGGLELTLWCDHRVASTDRRTILGLPETKLGLVPGWAGTVRLPRLAGLANAIDLVTSSRLVTGEEATNMGFVDQVSDHDSLLSTAVNLVKSSITNGQYKQRRLNLQGPVAEVGDTSQLNADYRTKIKNNKGIYAFAPKIALEHMLESANQSNETACQGESLAMAQVYGSPASRGLLNHFFLGEHNRRNPGFVDTNREPQPFSKIGIVGAGVMGKSIARLCLGKKLKVVLLDANQEILDAACSDLSVEHSPEQLQKAVDYSEFSDCDLIIESVVENVKIKQLVFEKISNHAAPTAVIATNTSATPIRQLKSSVADASRFCGIHFCHPTLMSMVEIIRGQETSDTTMTSAVAWIRSLRKMPIALRDSPGFVVNRLLAAMLDQSFRLFSVGHTIEEIDTAMRDFGFQAGPFEIVDIIGADTCMYAGRTMWDGGINAVTLSPLLPRQLKMKRLGRKSGQGFYRYESVDGPAMSSSETIQDLTDYVRSNDKIPVTEIAESILSVVTLEAANILNDGIAADHRDIDLSIINGFSFPAHQGGILFWADQFGMKKIVNILNKLATDEPKLAPTERLIEMANTQATFYSS